ncbi:unnamed protein product [Symbiodinium natans]|uniref:Transmembrane protein n=1 Tax=Symbiodinium natans TaxID=878477 RepID=A0A812N055_9DINO|nr:unnamed protein product [Symbiodinium natans]
MRRPSQSSEESIRSWTVPDEWRDSDARECSEAGSSSSSATMHAMPDLPLAPSPGGGRGSDRDVMLDVDDMMPSLIEHVTRMQVVNPEVMRVTPVFRALEQFAAALRGGSDKHFYHKSRASTKITTFWSHSWHGGRWKKILTVVTLYNGTAAVSLACLTGMVMMVLFIFGTLPGIDRGWWLPGWEWSCWSTSSGLVVASLVLACWRSQTRVFLDRICISQNDDRLKSEAILSLAGLLKNSDSMLVLWDPTWTERLWCLFELAAFLKSKTTQKQHLIVRPIFLGPLSIAIYLVFFAVALPIATAPIHTHTAIVELLGTLVLSFLAVAFPTVSTLRSYFRDLDTMKLQLLSISVDSTRSACCDQNHVTPSGGRMLCDRKIVKECVKIWFGSELSFENAVRTEVLDLLNRDLTEKVFSTPWALGVTSPLCLAFMDVSASMAAAQDDQQPAIALLVEGLVLWLCYVPATKDLMILLVRVGRKRPRSTCLEILKNALVLGAGATPVFVVLVTYGLTRFVEPDHALRRAGIFAGCTLVLVVCNFLLGLGLKALLQRPGW